MADQDDFGIVSVSCGVVVAHQLGPLDDFIDKCCKLDLERIERMAPVIRERVHRHRLILGRPQVIAQLFDQLAVGNLEQLVRPQPRGLHHLVARVVRMQRDPGVILGKHRPYCLRRERIFVAKAARRDAGQNDNWGNGGHLVLQVREW